MMFTSRRNRKGFTLIELMIVVLFGLILYQMTAVFGTSSLTIQEMDRTTQTARSELSLARARAMSGKGSSSWGVRFQQGAIIQFQGTTYATRNATYDLTTPISQSMKISGVSEIVFTAPFGEPSSYGSIVFGIGDTSKSLSVNEYGMIELQ